MFATPSCVVYSSQYFHCENFYLASLGKMEYFGFSTDNG